MPQCKYIKFEDGVVTINSSVKAGEYVLLITLTDSDTLNPGVTKYTIFLSKKQPINITPVISTTASNHTVSTPNKSGAHYFNKMTID